MDTSRVLHDALAKLLTEQRNPVSMDLDTLGTEGVLRLLNAQDKLVPLAVEREIPYIAEAVELIVHALRNGGRLIYFGAGTSGRLGVVDASECPPTFGTDPGLVRGVLAGGQAAMFRSQEGAEDDVEQARKDVDAQGVNPRDVVCGIAASRRTPFVVAAVARARELGAKTIYVTTNPRADFDLEVDVAGDGVAECFSPRRGPRRIARCHENAWGRGARWRRGASPVGGRFRHFHTPFTRRATSPQCR